MEQEDKQLVAQKIESKQYFSDSLSWYNSRFLKPQTEFYQMAICAVIAFAIFITAFISFVQIFPISKGSAILLSADVMADQNVTIKPIMGERENATSAYAKYMLQEFVTAFEEYRESKIDHNQQFIIQNAVEAVASEYILTNDKSNPDAPIVKYGKQATKSIYVDPDSIIFVEKMIETMKEGEKEGHATVQFVSSLLFADSRRDENFEADIKFKYKELIVDQVTHEIKQLPQIIITDYKIKPI